MDSRFTDSLRFDQAGCPCCDSDGVLSGRFIGIMGGRDWYRCRLCGLLFSWFGEVKSDKIFNWYKYK